jgi:hypothetical protein
MNKNNSYTKKTQYTTYLFLLLVSLLLLEGLYLSTTKSIGSREFENKLAFVQMSGLPDLAISTEATYIRHRSLSDVFSIYKDDATLREYFPSTYAISHSHTINKKSDYEK